MYDIFVRVKDTKKYVIVKFREFIMKEGEIIISNENLVGGKPKPPAAPGGKPVPNHGDPIKFTQALLALKERCDTFIIKSFSEDIDFQKANDKAFMDFMNQFAQTQYFVAVYTNEQYTKGFKAMNDDEIGKSLDAIIKIFCCFHGRDLFIKHYTYMLAKRLLN